MERMENEQTNVEEKHEGRGRRRRRR